MAGHVLVRAKEVRDDGSIVDIVIWQLADSVPPCTHTYKYRMYYGASGVCRVRYDNERGKGDHKHLGVVEMPYQFLTLAQLLADFRRDVEAWENDHESDH